MSVSEQTSCRYEAFYERLITLGRIGVWTHGSHLGGGYSKPAIH